MTAFTAVIILSLAPSAFAEPVSLLTQNELQGGAVETRSWPFGSGRGSVNTAMLAASETEAQVRRVEMFLKSGPAQTGDLRVVETAKPTK